MATPHRPRDNAGFTLVEVLVATIILVSAIVAVNAAMRQFTLYKERLARFERLYITTLSLRELISQERLSKGLAKQGTLNGLEYRYSCEVAQSNKNYIIGEGETSTGNKGTFTITLYRVSLSVDGQEFELYRTQYDSPARNIRDEI